jgi:hypothetical protein
MNRKMIALISACAAAALTLGAASAAQADTYISSTHHRYSVVNHTITTYWTNKAQMLGSCTAGSVAMTCTIAQGKSATRTVQVDFSATRSDITGSLGISSAYSVTTTVSCSAKISAYQRWGAWPVGSHHKYLVRDQLIQDSNGAILYTTIGTSYKYTFNPYASSIHCDLF